MAAVGNTGHVGVYILSFWHVRNEKILCFDFCVFELRFIIYCRQVRFSIGGFFVCKHKHVLVQNQTSTSIDERAIFTRSV